MGNSNKNLLISELKGLMNENKCNALITTMRRELYEHILFFFFALLSSYQTAISSCTVIFHPLINGTLVKIIKTDYSVTV